jgi:hypothetical protein
MVSTSQKICNQSLHPYWWTSWGFKNLDQELTFATMEMGVEGEQVQLLNELK